MAYWLTLQVLTRLPHINTLNVSDNRLTDRYGLLLWRFSKCLRFSICVIDALVLLAPFSVL